MAFRPSAFRRGKSRESGLFGDNPFLGLVLGAVRRSCRTLLLRKVKCSNSRLGGVRWEHLRKEIIMPVLLIILIPLGALTIYAVVYDLSRIHRRYSRPVPFSPGQTPISLSGSCTYQVQPSTPAIRALTCINTDNHE